MKIWAISDLMLDANPPFELFREWKASVSSKDSVLLMGNVAVNHKAFWFNQIKELPGEKVLFCGEQETNRTKWYEKFGFGTVVPFNETKIILCSYGPILLSHLPAYESVAAKLGTKFGGLSRKFNRVFDLNSCILNIHGHTQGKGEERHNTFDVSYRQDAGQKLLNHDQILELKFKYNV